MQENYDKVLELVEQIKADYAKVQKTGNKAAARRIRKALSSIAKTGKELRKDLLVVQRAKKEKN